MARHRTLLPVLLALALPAGCQGNTPPPPPPAPEAGGQPPPPEPGVASTPTAPGPPGGSPAAPPDQPAATGLVPLPTPREVIASLPLGRRDPFAASFPPLPPLPEAVPGAAAAEGGAPPAVSAGGRAVSAPTLRSGVAMPPLTPPPLTLPPRFRVTGLIHSGGVSEAVVEFGDRSGSLRPGDRGGRTTDLLPGGWSVAAVDVQRGRVTLQRGQRRVTAEL